jgi:IMP dehydrogenase
MSSVFRDFPNEARLNAANFLSRCPLYLSFDDVLLIPQYSEIESRSMLKTDNELDKNITLELPIISSPMDTVTEHGMAYAMHKSGGLGIIHRYNSIKEQAGIVGHMKDESGGVGAIGAAIGVTGDYQERAHELVKAGANVLCVDVAHGHHSMMRDALKHLKEKHGDNVHIMAGNVATGQGSLDLASWGADSIRVGIGGGSICSTRLVSGHGVPTLQSVVDCVSAGCPVPIIADGGIKTSGDVVKALAAGADFVMLGSMLAGTTQSPGEVFDSGSKKYKVYRGMASSEAQVNWRGKTSTPEGISTTIPYKGSVFSILDDLRGGIRSGMSYSGARTIKELQTKASFIQQTSAGRNESYTHILRR